MSAMSILALALGPVAEAGATVVTHRWMITGHAADQLESIDPLIASSYLDGPGTFLLGSPPPGWSSVPTMHFTSQGAFARAAAMGQLPGGLQAVVYDNEAWSLTPAAEQRDPGYYEQQFAALAHSEGLTAIMTPALDLVAGLSCGSGTYAQRFVRCDLAGMAASHGDVVEIQAQSLEADVGSYASLVSSAATQADAAHPGVVLLAGLSTGPNGATVTASQLLAAAQATVTTVVGWWLNIPGTSVSCPACRASQPMIADQFLRALDATGV